MKTFNAITVGILCGCVICGCRHQMEEYEASLVSGNYLNAASIATEEIKDGDDDELMWCLMSGSANRLAGSNDVAIAQFDRAEDVMIEHDGTSVFAKGATGAWAMLTNDKAFPYDGGGQDRIMTCLYKAIDFAAYGKPDAARTELNRAAQHQENWLFERRKEIADANERLAKDAAAYKKEKQSEENQEDNEHSVDSGSVVEGALGDADFMEQIKSNSGFDISTSGILDNIQPVDWMNPYASHVTGIFRWLNGDEARNYLKDTAACCRDNVTVLRDFAEIEQGLKPRNQIWIWLEDGLGPKREEWRIDLPLMLIPYLNQYVLYAGMAFPKLVYRDSSGDGWRVVTTTESSPMAELVNMDAKMKLEFDVYFRGALVREITRTAVKVGTQVALGVVAANVDDWRTRYALKASQVAVAAWAATVTAADTRSWTALPKRVYAMRVTRPDDGKISIVNSAGAVAEIVVPQGNSMVFISKPSVQGLASVKVATYP